MAPLLVFIGLSLAFATCSPEMLETGMLHGQPDTPEEVYTLSEKHIVENEFKHVNFTRLFTEGKAKRDVMLWVSYSVPNATVWNGILKSIASHKKSLTRVCINGYGVTAEGKFGENSNLNNSQYAKKYAKHIKAMGLPVTIMVTGAHNTTYLLKMLHSKKLREKFIQAALLEALTYNYDGYNMDVEQQGVPGDNARYMDFLKEFASRLHAINKTLTSDMGGFCAWPDYMRLTCEELKTLGLDQVLSMDTYTHNFTNFRRYVKTAQSALGGLYAAGMERTKLLGSKEIMDFLISENVSGIGIFRNPPTIEAYWDAMAYFKYK